MSISRDAIVEALELELVEFGIMEIDLRASVSDLGLDSMDALEILYRMEERLNVSIPAETWLEAKSLDDLVFSLVQSV